MGAEFSQEALGSERSSFNRRMGSITCHRLKVGRSGREVPEVGETH